jgi:capsular exopolysaccharide synthesis family protein
MELVHYLRILRRRWALLVVITLLALAAAWSTTPEQAKVGPVIPMWNATATLISNPTSTTPVNLPITKLFLTVGEVPKRVAKKVGYAGEPQVLAAGISASSDGEVGTLSITATNRDGDEAAKLVNAFADEIIAFLQERDQAEARKQMESVLGQLDKVTDDIEALDRKLSADPGDAILQAQREAQQARYTALYTQYQQLSDQAAAAAPLMVLQPGVPVPGASGGGGFTPPTDRSTRLLFALGLGLALGIALALVVERVDSRLRTREQAEDAFGLPVIAEVPGVPVRQRSRPSTVSAEKPGGEIAEAYRSLRSAAFMLPARSLGPSHDWASPASGEPKVLLVTSARSGEGKTTTVANLAAVMAEAGRRVIVLSCDFRAPQIHRYLDVAQGAGVSDLLAADRLDQLPQVLRPTSVAGVRLATSGQETTHPGALLATAGPLIAAAREEADLVIIDTAPLLVVNDTTDLFPHVDAVVVVSRFNRATVDQAGRVRQLLTRVGVPVLGVVLVGVGRRGAYGPRPRTLESLLAGSSGRGRRRRTRTRGRAAPDLSQTTTTTDIDSSKGSRP